MGRRVARGTPSSGTVEAGEMTAFYIAQQKQRYEDAINKNMGFWDRMTDWVRSDTPRDKAIRRLNKEPVDKRKNIQKLFDQLNPFDNSRTYKQSVPQNTKSIVGQAIAPAQAVISGGSRAIGGLVSDVSGFYDLITPGKGTNRLTKFANERNENMDEYVKNQGLDTGLYKAGQFATDVLTFAGPGLILRGATKGAKGANAATRAYRAWESATATDKALSTARQALNWAVRPSTLSNVAFNTAQGAGYRSARGIDVSPGTVGLDVGMSYGMGAALGLTGRALGIEAPKPAKVKAKPTRRAPPMKKKEIQDPQLAALYDHAVLLNNEDSRLAGLGYSETHPVRKANSEANRQLSVAMEARRQELAQYPSPYNLDKNTSGHIQAGPAPQVSKTVGDITPPVKSIQEGMTEAITTPTKTAKVAEAITPEEAPVRATVKQANDIIDRTQGSRRPDVLPEEAVYRNAQGELQKTSTGKLDAPEMLSKQAGHWYSRWMTSIGGKISQMGESGKKLSNLLYRVQDRTDELFGQWTSKVPTVLGLSKKEHIQFANTLRALDRAKTPQDLAVMQKFLVDNPNIARAVDEWQKFIPEVRQLAIDTGIKDIGDLGINYYPRDLSRELSSVNKKNKIIDHLVSTGQAKDRLEAERLVKIIQDKMTKHDFKHFSMSRNLDLPDFEKSGAVVSNYLHGAAESVSKRQYLGADEMVASGLKEGIIKEGYSDITDMYDKAMNYVDYARVMPKVSKVSGATRQIMGFTKLQTAAIMNASQLINTAVAMGPIRTAKAIARFATDPAMRAEVRRMGAVSDQIIRELQQGGGFEGALSKLGAFGFNPIEKMNRYATAIASIDYANKLAKKAASGDMKALSVLQNKLHVDGKIGAQLTQDQIGQAARGGVNLTQFRVNAKDLPEWAASPIGKMVVQFRTFTYKQGKFVFDEVLKEARHGNVRPLATYVMLGSIVGSASGAAKNFVRGQDNQNIPQNKGDVLQQAAEGMRGVGAMGLLGDALFLGETKDSYSWPKYAAGSLGGPSASTIVETLMNSRDALQGNWTPLGRQAVKSLPVVGPGLQNRILPYKMNVKKPASSSRRIRR